jgi:hypothetical protein
MDKVAASYPVFSNLSRPPTPPAGYTWYPQPKWALAQTSQAPENNVNQFGSHIRFEDRNGGQYQQYTGNGSFDNQHGLVNSDESSDPSTNYQQFQGQWFGPAMDSSNILHRATAPSLPIKDEDPMSGIDLYGADDQPATSKQQQLKVEYQEPLNLPTPPTNSSRRRDNQNRLLHFKCFTCKNYFASKQALGRHASKMHPTHSGVDTRTLPSQNQSKITKSRKHNVKKAHGRM